MDERQYNPVAGRDEHGPTQQDPRSSETIPGSQTTGTDGADGRHWLERWDGRHRLAAVFPQRLSELARQLAQASHPVVLDAELPDGRWVLWVAGSQTQVLDVRGLPAPEGMWRLKAAVAAWPNSEPVDIVLITRRPFLIYDALNDLDLPYQVECHGPDFYFAIG
ncbi:MAG: hypothetical protein K6U87_14540 [Firmicutes bacterium]|nr:hypothetical protein [Bacillota bacterium]